MKYKTTDREQRENNYLVVAIGYCDIQNIEKYLNANSYTCGIYGWRADFYNINGAFTISTGYQPLNFIYKNTKDNREKYEQLKKAILQLEKDIENKKFAFCKNHNYEQGKKFIIKKLDRLYTKIFLEK